MGLFSCGGDDDGAPSYKLTDLIGIWAEDPSYTSRENFVYSFAEDGVYYSAVYDRKNIKEVTKGKWSLSGNKITISDGKNKVIAIIKSLSSKTLVLGMENSNWSITLTKTASPN